MDNLFASAHSEWVASNTSSASIAAVVFASAHSEWVASITPSSTSIKCFTLPQHTPNGLHLIQELEKIRAVDFASAHSEWVASANIDKATCNKL